MKKIILFVVLLVSALGMTINAQPSAPTNLTATQATWENYLFIKLDWQAANGNFRDRVFFNVYRKEVGNEDSSGFEKRYSRIAMNSWSDKDVHRGETYTYYVTAVNANGESAASDTVQITLDSVAAKATITGVLKSSVDGSAIAGGRVSLIPVFGWGLRNTITDSTGSFSFNANAGTYILLASAPGFLAEYYDNVFDIFNASKIVLNAGDSLNIDVSLQPRTAPKKFMLSGTVKDSLDNPVEARIEVYSVIHNAFSYKYFNTETDSSGNYSVPVREGDTVVVFAHSKDKEYISQFYNNKTSFLDADRIGISGDVSNINFVLQHKPVYNNGISGTVVNSNNLAVTSLVFAIKLDDKDIHHGRHTTLTDSLGAYSFTNLEPGNYILMAIPQGGYKPTFFKYDGSQTLRWKDADSVVITSTSTVSGINFTVLTESDSGAATISGHVKDQNGNPMVGAMVFATDDNQQTYSFGITNQYGQYTISGLIPGNYSVSSDLYGYTSTGTSTTTLDYSTSYTASASFTLAPENVTSVESSNNNVVKTFELAQNYPNPFNPTTNISYSIPYSSKVVLKIFNILGKEVATLVNSEQTSGNHIVVFDGSKLASGVYFYQINAGNFVATKKLILMK